MSINLKNFEDIFSTLFTKTEEYKEVFTPLVVIVNNLAIVLMRKDLFNSSGIPMNRTASGRMSPSMQCLIFDGKYEIDPSYISPNSLDTIGLLLTPSQEVDHGTPQDFWKGTAIRIHQLSIQLMENFFSPSTDLSHGFHYSHRGIVVRGHERYHMSGASALNATRNELEDILDEAEKLLFDRESLDLRPLTNTSEMSAAYNKKKLREGVDTKLNRIFSIAESVHQMRLYEGNEQQEGAIKKSIDQFDNELTSLKPIVSSGYFSCPLKRDKLLDFERKLEQDLETVRRLKEKIPTAAQEQRLEDLNQSYSKKTDELKKIVVDADITSALFPIARIYCALPIVSLEDLYQHLLLVFSKILSTLDQAKKEKYLMNEDYRERLLRVAEMEGQGTPRVIKLREIHEYWKQLDLAKPASLILNSLENTHRELMYQFDSQLQERQTPSTSQASLAVEMERALHLKIEQIRLMDLKLSTAGLCEQKDNRIHYFENYYSQRREELDPQLFLLLSQFLELCVMNKQPDSLIELIARFMHSYYIAPERLYGSLNGKALFRFLCHDMITPFNGNLKTIEKMKEILENFSPDTAAIVLEKWELIDSKISELETLAKKFSNFYHSTDWKDAYADLLKRRDVLSTEIQSEIENVLKTTSSIYKEEELQNLEQMSKEVCHSLERLRVLQSKRSTLMKDLTSLIQSLKKPNTDDRINKGLTEAKDNAEGLRKSLVNLKRGTTPHDLEIRDRAIEQLGHVIEALTPNSQSELLIRITGLKSKLESSREVGIDHLQLIRNDSELNSIDGFQQGKDDASLIEFLLKNEKKCSIQIKKKLEKHFFEELIPKLTIFIDLLSKKRLGEYQKRLQESILPSSPHLIRREWLTDKYGDVSWFYTSNMTETKIDPHHKKNETHIRI